MTPQYGKWIAVYVKGDGYGQCADATLAMAAAYPELTRVRGHYHDGWWGKRAHWWLVAPDGSIVDPTAAQFPTAGNGQYVSWVEGATEPTGKCADCGGYCYDSTSFCSAACAAATDAFLMRGASR